MLEVTETEIKNRLAFDNPWWSEGAVDKRFRDWPRRAYFDGFYRYVSERRPHRAVVLMGPRRVGKTVMLIQAIQALIESGVAPKTIAYVSVDTPTYTGLSLDRLLKLFMASHEHDRSTALYVIFDEIQYHPDWERHLKSLVDSHPAIRFVVSGSAAAALKLKSRESGAGRFTDFLLPPLNFAEFLRFRNIEDALIDRTADTVSTADHDALNEAFVDYMNYGGFPETVLDLQIRTEMDRFIASDIIDKVLLRDLPSLYGISDTQELKRLFTVLAYNSGEEVSYESLSKASGVAKNTLRKYLEYLEAAFLIQRLARVDENARRFKRQTQFKIYLSNPSIRAALFGPIGADDAAAGRLVETTVISQVAQSIPIAFCFYARWKSGEVDLVYLHPVEQTPCAVEEIKWSDRFVRRPGEELSSLVAFCKRAGLKGAAVLSRSETGSMEAGGIEIRYRPAALSSYFHAINALALWDRGSDPKNASPVVRNPHDRARQGRTR